ncbi:Heterogeneous nuclear ribonucleoprotein like [Quillaja saponaria]|uniref:Heterogeneous nuclear ribonucleoprotein like n=1 Tax=Quillaja saponaria TaxID=32244 RepID=A0AAD7PFL3_QUISA|nr:Heterogeneous nuclear ribonucleoprotein like [Quillaja saponaria]
MRTRNADAPKSATAKKTPPGRKSATKTPTTPSDSVSELATPKSVETRRSASKTKQVKKKEASPLPSTNSDSKPEHLTEEVKDSADVAQVTPEAKVAAATKSAAKRTPGRTKATVKAFSTPKSGEQMEAKVEKNPKQDNLDEGKIEEPIHVEVANVDDGKSKEEEKVDDNGQSSEKEKNNLELDEPVVKIVGESVEKEEEIVEVELTATAHVGNSLNQDESIIMEFQKSPGMEESGSGQAEEEAKEKLKDKETRDVGDQEESNIEPVNMEEKDKLQQENTQPENFASDEGTAGYFDKVDLGEHREEDLAEDDPEEPSEETETWEEERRQLTAIAKERKIKKEHEIFVGGLDRDATEEDLMKVFEKIGEVVEVRLHKNLSTNKNKGYAFVKFANKEHAKQALSEMKNPVIHGKRCGTAPSEDNDTLFLGNICNTWTKEAIKQKLKDYGVEGVENITLVPDVQHEGLSRGFAFLEFSCHAEAMLAYKKLQKPDVIFGHPERTAKVAFAEPLREPDPEVMAQVKSVFVDGLPPHWDEDRVREKFNKYGEIGRIVLARNMSTAKRKDFGFVDFSTHEAAVSCVDGVNNSELGDGTSKTKVRARLSNPLPKTQAVKGGMCGGFRIGHARAGPIPRFGRGFGRGGQHFNHPNFHRERDFYYGGRGQIGRTGFPHELDFDISYADFPQRQFVPRGGRRGPLGGGHYGTGRGSFDAGPSRPYFDRPWYAAPDRAPVDHILARRPYSPEGQFDRSFLGRHFDDPYLYGDNVPGVKRPYYMTDQDPDHMGPSRIRPRLDYTDPAPLFHVTRYHGIPLELEAVSIRMNIMVLIMVEVHIHLSMGVIAHMDVDTIRFKILRWLEIAEWTSSMTGKWLAVGITIKIVCFFLCLHSAFVPHSTSVFTPFCDH